MTTVMPTEFHSFFWGDNLKELNWAQHKKYIVQTLLEKGDMPALRWLFQHVSKTEVHELLPTLRLGHKSSNFWKTYLS